MSRSFKKSTFYNTYHSNKFNKKYTNKKHRLNEHVILKTYIDAESIVFYNNKYYGEFRFYKTWYISNTFLDDIEKEMRK